MTLTIPETRPLSSELLSDFQQYLSEVSNPAFCLSDEDYQELAERVRLSRRGLLDPQQGQDALLRLFHGHLRNVVRLASKWKTLTNAALDLLDLIQEGNIALFTTIQEYPFDEQWELGSYLHKRVAWAIVDAIYQKREAIRIPATSQRYAEQKGGASLLPSQPCSLEKPLSEEDGAGSLADVLATPAFILSPPPLCPPEKVHLLALLLAELAPREREVLHLRYGLGMDEIAYTQTEIATLLSVSEGTVADYEHHAMMRIRTLYADYQRETGQSPAFLAQDEGLAAYLEQRRADRAAFGDPPHTRMANARLYEAFTALQQQEVECITATRLALEAGVERRTAGRYLRQRGYNVTPSEVKRQHLDEAYAQMMAEQERISIDTLAVRAHVSRALAIEYLRSVRQVLEQEERASA